jgi:hypothetical protein
MPAITTGVAISFAIQALTQLPALIQAGADAARAIEETITALRAMQTEGRDPTVAEWDTLNARITTDLAKLDMAVEGDKLASPQ